MNFKKIYFISLLILLLFSLSTVNAENTSDLILSSDLTSNSDLTLSSDLTSFSDLTSNSDFNYNSNLYSYSNSSIDINILNEDNDNDLYEEDYLNENNVGTFTDLANEISSANGELNLTRDYRYDEETDYLNYVNGITLLTGSSASSVNPVVKSLTIYGNNHTIDGGNLSKIFVNTYGTVTLRNLNFINSYLDSGHGSCIDNSATMVIRNCTFNSHKTANSLIYNTGAMTIHASEFEYNNVSGLGTVIFNFGGVLRVYKSDFNHNVGASYGCVYSNGGTLVVSNSNFTDNYGKTGSAIYSLNTDTTLYNDVFDNNNATNGAVYVSGGLLTVYDSNFTSNYASGSVSAIGSDNGNVLIVNNGIFSNNYRSAVSLSQSSATIVNSVFDSNTASNGGAIYSLNSNLSISKSEFENNSVSNSYAYSVSNGGAIYSVYTNLTINDTNFTSNKANSTARNSKNFGSAIYLISSDSNINNSIFSSNYAKIGAIYNSVSNLTLSNSIFENNTGEGLIYNLGTLYLSNNTINNNTPEIYNLGTINSTVNINILENSSYSVDSIDTPIILTANLTDDNGNLIREGNLSFLISTENSSDIYELNSTYNNDSYLFEADYTVSSNKTLISAIYSNISSSDNLNVYTSVLMNIHDVNLNFTISNASYGENALVNINLTANDNMPLSSTVKVIIADTEYNISVVDGIGLYNITGLRSGFYTALAIFEGFNSTLNSNSSSSTKIAYTSFNILKSDAVLTISSENITYTDTETINITLTDKNSNPLNSTLNISIADKNYAVDVINGLATLNLSDLSGGNYTVIASFDNENYNFTTASSNFNVEKLNTTLIFANMTTNVVLNGNRTGEYFNVTLTDINGKALANKTIYIGFNGKVYKRTTNSTGGVQLQINIGYQSANTFSITFLGDENYSGNVSCAIIVVNTLNTTLKAAKTTYTYKSSAKTKTVKATLKLTNGTVISGQTISIKINGAIYQASTNSKGVATIKVPITTKGTYSATLTFAGNNQYTKSTASVKVKIS